MQTEVKIGGNGGNRQGKASDAPPVVFGPCVQAINQLLEDCATEMGGCDACGVMDQCVEYQARHVASGEWNVTPHTIHRLQDVVGELVQLRGEARRLRPFMQKFTQADVVGEGRG